MLERTSLFAESWNVAWRKKNSGNILNDKDTPFNIIKNDYRYWAADPFLFEFQNETYIFAELYDYIHCRGSLGYCKLDENSRSKWKQIILEDYHLSYPYIVKKENDIYIIPESGANESLYVYIAIQFPDKWKKVKVLRENVQYGDTTPFLWKGHPYALTYDVKDSEKYHLVILDLEDSLQDKMLPYENVEFRRPAGKFFMEKKQMIRPAQNCENDYGEGLVFYECGMNGSGEYWENEIQRIVPSDLKYSHEILLDGMHTYNSTDTFEIIDIKTRRFNILNFIFRIISKFRR